VNTEQEIRIPEILQAAVIFSEKTPTVDCRSRKSGGIFERAGWLKKDFRMASGDVRARVAVGLESPARPVTVARSRKRHA
jgi:hypothetical protein